MKDNQTDSYVKRALKVPKGLWELLEKMMPLTGQTPAEYIELTLRKEVDCILSDLDSEMFDLKLLATRYKEGSDVSDMWTRSE